MSVWRPWYFVSESARIELNMRIVASRIVSSIDADLHKR